MQSHDATRLALSATKPDGTPLPPGTFRVLTTLCDYVGSNNGLTVFPSQKTLAKRLKLSERTVRTHMRRLEDWRLIERRHRSHGRGKGRTSDVIELKFLEATYKRNPSELQPEGWRIQAEDLDAYKRKGYALTTGSMGSAKVPVEVQEEGQDSKDQSFPSYVSVHHRDEESKPTDGPEASHVPLETQGEDNEKNGRQVREDSPAPLTALPDPDASATPEQLERLRREAERLEIPELAEIRLTVRDADWLLIDAGQAKPGNLMARHLRRTAGRMAQDQRAEPAAA